LSSIILSRRETLKESIGLCCSCKIVVAGNKGSLGGCNSTDKKAAEY
jgi:hypothetical protein